MIATASRPLTPTVRLQLPGRVGRGFVVSTNGPHRAEATPPADEIGWDGTDSPLSPCSLSVARFLTRQSGFDGSDNPLTPTYRGFARTACKQRLTASGLGPEAGSVGGSEACPACRRGQPSIRQKIFFVAALSSRRGPPHIAHTGQGDPTVS